nr:hypothetical protein [Deltaproteobacteria bacterium]
LFADPAFAAATDLDDVKARASSLYAQALLAAGRPAEAWRWSEGALRLAKSLGDEAGLAEIRTLHQSIREALTSAAQQRAAVEHGRRLAERSVEEILIGLGSAEERADALVKKANAEIDAGRPAEGAEIARRAVEEAASAAAIAPEVFARIAIARAAPAEAGAQLLAAWRRAERANEFNLVGAVARACELLGVRLPALVGPNGVA